uniref:Uncharacterized protein n=2 Tax=Chenopodium quinoa TaxID=63459 RepID=A0A803N6E7_CHEQI
MNDLVFVMYNLKSKRRHEKRASKPITQPIVLDELPSDDEWIAEVEEPILPTNDAWFTNLDRAARRFARKATRNGDEIHEDHDDEIDEVTNLSDNDDEIASTYIGSNEFNDDDEFGDGNNFENEPASVGGTDVRSDDVDYGNLSFGYDD